MAAWLRQRHERSKTKKEAVGACSRNAGVSRVSSATAIRHERAGSRRPPAGARADRMRRAPVKRYELPSLRSVTVLESPHAEVVCVGL